MTTTLAPSVADLQHRLPELMLRDRRRLQRRLDGARRVRDPGRREAALAAVARAVDDADSRVARRRAGVPAVSYPAALPVSERKDDLAAAIAGAQVVIVAGETGSGKTTQLPKICLELGRGVLGRIGHTQPRRLAARTVAERIAEELGTPLGSTVGYQVRFGGSVGEDTLVKVMTDGILLAELQHDPLLEQYDTLIVDEAHERSLNIDFLLGYLVTLLPRRPDLKVVITSATIDVERFARHFGDVPVVEVSGRTYPVEVRYRPLVDSAGPGADTGSSAGDPVDEDVGGPRDQTEAILDAVDELIAEGPGDILVFLSGEREIRDTADALRRRQLRDTEVLPLYARLSAAEQHRVFSPHRGRRIVLATNVAETSLTVPGIRYVVDPGTARISRYSNRLKVQRLPIEAISQASANQRAGRCGRTADGICIRLYAEDDFAARPAYTDPEILRTNLASVILQMAALGLGDVAAFPFLDPPDKRQVRDGVALLVELGALDPGAPGDARSRLTPVGRRLAALPVDPRLGRMVLEAGVNGCVREVLVITAALSIQDPRERPADRQQAADEQHARFADPTSDFLAYLNLWTYLQEQQKALSSSAFRRLCKAEYLHYLRVREWQDLYAQLRSVLAGVDLALNSTPAASAQVHRSLLAGLLSHIGTWDAEKREYAGARGARFALFPGSGLARKRPRWVMAAELVETSRLWARTVARIDPDEVEPLAAHLIKRSYNEPHWEKKQGAVMAYEKVTLYGVPLVARRKVPYARVDPALCRELFLRHALVEGDWATPHPFWHANRRLLEDAEELEHRVRRRGLVVDDEELFAFYDARVPADVVSARHFDAWWKKARRATPDLLTFDPAALVDASAGGTAASREHYPDEWRAGDLRLALSYVFEPGSPSDGVTVHVPLPLLAGLRPEPFSWQVPGLRHELATALIRSLPKALRVNFVPAPDVAAAALAALVTGGDRPAEPAEPAEPTEPLPDALGRELRRRAGVPVPADAWDLERVPAHLRMRFAVEDAQGRELAAGRDLEALQLQLRGRVRAAVAAAVQGPADSIDSVDSGDGAAGGVARAGIERAGLREWPGGELPRTVQRSFAGALVTGYPALVDEGAAVGVRVFASEAEQRQAMAAGVRRLLLLTVPSPVKAVLGRLPAPAKLALSASPYPTVPALLEDCVAAGVDALVAEAGGPVWTAEAFDALRTRVAAGLAPVVSDAVATVARLLPVAYDVQRQLDALTSPALAPARTDAAAQLAGLVFPGFVSAAGVRRLPDLLRYLRALERRLDRLGDDPRRDLLLQHEVEQVQQAYRVMVAALPPHQRGDEAVRAVRWMIEELRVSLFAQQLGTAYPVSPKRIRKAIEALAA